eukprot:TRINITY_DN1983_c0_g1_i1.p1 TRINITY_DN1983_c0_g1~~TRINITY_DN1983_c0_g1_i1.p1  ORF type:complete len:291 (+),score=45.89 TRINITY_DN1983_c0_g1_i1:170-1042(+)
MVQLVIKSPNPAVGDFRLEIESINTIYQLKQQLSERYPSKPAVELQKLIFAGKLLKNESSIAEVLAQYDMNSVQTFHLIVSKQAPPSQPQSAPFAANYQYQANFQQMPPINFQFQNLPPQFGMARPQNPQFVPPQQRAPANNNDADNLPREQGGGIYLLAKLAFFVYLFSSGGSTIRTALLVIGACFIYLYQSGHLRIAAQINVQRPQPPQPQPQPQPQREDRDVANPVTEGEQAEPAQAPPANRGFVSELNGILLPFFYSLFPSWAPQQVNIPPANPQLNIPMEQPIVN